MKKDSMTNSAYCTSTYSMSFMCLWKSCLVKVKDDTAWNTSTDDSYLPQSPCFSLFLPQYILNKIFFFLIDTGYEGAEMNTNMCTYMFHCLNRKILFYS